MIQNVMETKIPQTYSTALYNEREYDFGAEYMDKILYTLFYGVSSCLGEIKSKDKPVGFFFEENNKDLIAAAIVEYHPNEDSTKPGNWSYIWTFDEADVPVGTMKVSITDIEMLTYFVGTASSKFSMGFNGKEAIIELTRYALRTISHWLDENAVEGEDNGVQLDNVFIARCGVEDGVVTKSLEPLGETKVLVKGDENIEV